MKLSNTGGRDFAHKGTGFLTWHRLFLLWFEREVRLTISGGSDFTLSYWDWTDPEQREVTLSGPLNITNSPFNGWKSFCWYENQNGNICDLNQQTDSPLRRCPIIAGEDVCNRNYNFWPSVMDVKQALNIATFDRDPYDVKANNSFRNFLEGFVPQAVCDDSEELCNTKIKSTPLLRKLHNSVSF